MKEIIRSDNKITNQRLSLPHDKAKSAMNSIPYYVTKNKIFT